MIDAHSVVMKEVSFTEYECEAYKRIRFELPGESANISSKVFTSQERMVWERGLTLKLLERRTGHEWKDTERKQEGWICQDAWAEGGR